MGKGARIPIAVLSVIALIALGAILREEMPANTPWAFIAVAAIAIVVIICFCLKSK